MTRDETWAALSAIEKELLSNLVPRMLKDPEFPKLKAEVDKANSGSVYQEDKLLYGLYLTAGNPAAGAIATRLGIRILPPNPKGLFAARTLEIPIPATIKFPGHDDLPMPGSPVEIVGSIGYAGATPERLVGYKANHSWRAGDPLKASSEDPEIVQIAGWFVTGGPRLFPCPFCNTSAGITTALSDGWPSQKAVICNNKQCNACIEEIYQGPPLIQLWNTRPF
jgi:hypothetical protein